jgi:hypothetical protein
VSRLLVALVLLLALVPARAEPIAADDFSGYAPGSIDGAGGGSGWQGAWSGAGSAVEAVVDTSDAPLRYRAASGEQVVGGGQALQLSGNDDFAAFRERAGNRRYRDVYVSMLIRFTGTPDDGDSLAFWFERGGAGDAPDLGIDADGGADLFAGTRADTRVSRVELVPGRTYFLVGHLSKPNNGRPTRYDEFRLWVNPVSLASEPPPDAVSRGDGAVADFARVGFRAENLDAGDAVVVDRLRLGTRWEDVAGPDTVPALALEMDERRWSGATGEVLDAASGFHGTASGGASTAEADPAIPGDPGTCRYGELDGVDDHVRVPHHPDLDGAEALTYAAWIRPAAWGGGIRQIMGKGVHGGPGGPGQMGLFGEGGRLKARIETSRGAFEVSTSRPPTNRWSHVAAVFSGRRLELYVDGVVVARRNFGPSMLEPTTADLVVGRQSAAGRFFFAGAVDEVRVYAAALDESAVRGLMAETRPCATAPVTGASAFRLEHDGSGIYCLDEPLRATAVDSAGQVVADYDGEITLATSSGRGTWRLAAGGGLLVDATPDDGLARYRFAPGDGGSAAFRLAYRSGPSVVNVDVSERDDPAVRDDDGEGPLRFAPSGFTVTAGPVPDPPPSPLVDPLASQTAGTEFPLHLTAYGITADDPACGVIESYQGSRNLTFATAYLNPAAGTRLATVDGEAADGATARPVTFTDGRAAVTVGYRDVGRVRLDVRDTASFDHALAGASNGFVVRPAALAVTAVRAAGGGTNPGATAPGGPAFVAAGEPFRVEVTAVDALGAPTPNYARETPPEGVRVASDGLVFPAGGRNGSSGDVQHGDAFAPSTVPGTLVNDRVVFDEVGSIVLRPAVADGDYLGSGPVAGQPSGAVGRFCPAVFELASSAVTTACGTFTYMDQPGLGVSFRVLALNALGGVTQNYDAALLAGNVAELRVSAEAHDDGLDRSARLTPLDADWRRGEAAVSRSDAAFARLTVPDGPLDPLQLALRVLDPLDGVALAGLDQNPLTAGDCVAAGNCSARALGGPIRLVYGRLSVLPASGPETEPLDVPLEAEVFTDGAFLPHRADACSLYAGTAAALVGHQGALQPGETAVAGPVGTTALVSGAADPADPLVLAAPGPGNDGSVELRLDVAPWLEFPWLGAGDTDPRARLSFGRFRGHDRIIYWGEAR